MAISIKKKGNNYYGNFSVFNEIIQEEKMRTPIIRDIKYFGDKYIPEKIQFRHAQQKQIARILHSAKYGKSILKIDGDYGTGKTLVARGVLQEFNELEEYKEIPACYINAGEFSTRYKILSRLHQQLLGLNSAKQGYSDSYFLEEINKKLAKYPGAVLILDEIDKVIETDGDSILYILTEMENLSLILISNYPRWEETVSGKVYSRIRRGSRERFPKYDLYELEGILEQRAKKGLNEETYNREIISYIAEQVYREGDARILIELLKLSAEIAERHKAIRISREHVNEAKIKLNRNLLEDNIREQTIHKKFILISIATRQDKGNLASSDEVYESYKNLTREYIEKHPNEDIVLLSKPSIYRLLNELLDQGIIEKEKGFYAKGIGRKPYVYKSFFTAKELFEIYESNPT